VGPENRAKWNSKSRSVVADLGNARAIAEPFSKITTLNLLVKNAAKENYGLSFN
jgi:hypothetical protein